jgi:hypothetical protein
MLRTRERLLRVLDAQDANIVAFPKQSESDCPAIGHRPCLDFRRIEYDLPLTVVEVSWLLCTTPERVYRIPKTELPYMTRGAGPWHLYDLRDVKEYIRRQIRQQSPELISQGQPDPLDVAADSVRRKRSSNGERYE